MLSIANHCFKSVRIVVQIRACWECCTSFLHAMFLCSLLKAFCFLKEPHYSMFSDISNYFQAYKEAGLIVHSF